MNEDSPRQNGTDDVSDESIEDALFLRAILEGEISGKASKEEVLEILRHD